MEDTRNHSRPKRAPSAARRSISQTAHRILARSSSSASCRLSKPNPFDTPKVEAGLDQSVRLLRKMPKSRTLSITLPGDVVPEDIRGERMKSPKSPPTLTGTPVTNPEGSAMMSNSRPIDIPRSPGSANNVYVLGRSVGSTIDMSNTGNPNSRQNDSNYSQHDYSVTSVASSIQSSSVPQHMSAQNAARLEKEKRKEKMKFPRLGRRGSLKDERSPKSDGEGSGSRMGNIDSEEPHYIMTKNKLDDLSPRTAPLEKDQAFREMMMGSSANRNRSADRYLDIRGEPGNNGHGTATQPIRVVRPIKSGNKEESGSRFLSTIGNKAAGGFGRAAKGLAKLGRSGSTNEKEPAPPTPRGPYIATVINLPLIEQTRTTRISKRLQDCRDKTEYWMPALPWRCIDYLNAKAPTSEGIYRVPGSDRDVKHWEQRFDKEYDIDLLHPDTPIYDINTIGSMLKNWLRALPDTIIPTDIQNEVQIKVTVNGTKEAPEQAPQELKDALSTLPPFNYYLLFAITCHISLLNAHPETTKMNFNALRICLQPCLRISPLFFQWLVQDWRNCWQGCWTEKEYLEREVEREREQDAAVAAAASNQATLALRGKIPHERSASPNSANGMSLEQDRQKTAVNKDGRNRQPESESGSAVPSRVQSPSIMGGTPQKGAKTMHKQNDSLTNPTLSAHAPLSTAFDASQAAFADTQQPERKPVPVSINVEGRAINELPQQQREREGSVSKASKLTSHLHIRPPRLSSRDPPTEGRSKMDNNNVGTYGRSGSTSYLDDGKRIDDGRALPPPQISPIKILSPMAPIDLS